MSIDRQNPNGVACGCCSYDCDLIFESHQGYRSGRFYDIYHCRNCDTSQAFPFVVDTAIYDFIYNNIEEVPGYQRYGDYERGVLAAATPLDYLAESEYIYWAIREYFREKEKCPVR